MNRRDPFGAAGRKSRGSKTAGRPAGTRYLRYRRGAGKLHIASYQVQRLAETKGTVSIKAGAADADGNTIEQTILDAFTLTGRR